MKYYAMIDGERRGPFDLNQLADAGVRPSTYIWCKGMEDWEKAEENADVCRMFRNRIYDLMHPGSVDAENRALTPAEPETEPGNNTPPTRFDHVLRDSGLPPLPSLDEIEERENQIPPSGLLLPMAIIVTLLFFPPTGIVAIYYAIKAKKAWHDEPGSKIAGSYTRAAKMWTGLTLFLGMIFYAFLVRLS